MGKEIKVVPFEGKVEPWVDAVFGEPFFPQEEDMEAELEDAE